MSEFEVRIEELSSMRVAVFRGYSRTPELDAHALAVAFAQEKGLIDQNNYLKTYGFNKPAPWVTNEEEYGYEIWVVVPPEVDIPPYVMQKDFPGAKCAVTSIKKLAEIGDAWQYLYQWVGDNKDLEHAHMDGLEQVLSPSGTKEEDLAFNLFLPVLRR